MSAAAAATPPTNPRPAMATMIRKVNDFDNGNAVGVSRPTQVAVSPPARPANEPASAYPGGKPLMLSLPSSNCASTGGGLVISSSKTAW